MIDENDLLKSNSSIPCTYCVALDDDLVKARSRIALLELNASLPCISCESLLAEINELKLTHTTCVDELEHARAEICEMKSMPCSKCSLLIVDDACHTSCDDDNALVDVNDVACSCDFICTSCIDLESEVLALKKMRDDMSAKLVVHDEMSANLEKEIENVRNIPCRTCERLKFENEALRTRCKSPCAKGLDSRISCHSDVDASKVAFSQPELTSSFERESLDDGTCASALDSSSIATPKLGVFLMLPKMIRMARVLLTYLGLMLPNRSPNALFARRMGIPLSFAFAVSSTSDVCMLKLLRSHLTFLMAHVILMWAPSRVLGLMLLALSPKGLPTYKRMVIRPLRPCIPIGLCTIALIVGRMGIKRAFVTAVQGECGELVLLGLWLFIAFLMA